MIAAMGLIVTLNVTIGTFEAEIDIILVVDVTIGHTLMFVERIDRMNLWLTGQVQSLSTMEENVFRNI